MENKPAPLQHIEKIENHYHNHVDTEQIVHLLNHIHKHLQIMAANTDKALADLADIKNQLGKIGTESATLLQKITDLETAVANTDTPQSVVDAVADVKAQAQIVDDLVPDAAPV